jgi:hypothetical protein
MIKMAAEYAQKLFDEGGYVFGHRAISCWNDLFVIDDDDDYAYRNQYYGTKLIDGKLQVDEQGMVVFKHVEPIIDENTRFSPF